MGVGRQRTRTRKKVRKRTDQCPGEGQANDCKAADSRDCSRGPTDVNGTCNSARALPAGARVDRAHPATGASGGGDGGHPGDPGVIPASAVPGETTVVHQATNTLLRALCADVTTCADTLSALVHGSLPCLWLRTSPGVLIQKALRRARA